MKKFHLAEAIAVAGWTGAIVLTVLATARPDIRIAVGLWTLLLVAAAATATVSVLITRSQYELSDDVAEVIETHHPKETGDVRRLKT